MRQLFAFLAGLFFTINIQAQQAAAQLAFEEAETLYNELHAAKLPSNQRIDQIDKVNQKLNEVEKIVGEKPKTLYLRALANNSCFEYLNEQALYTSKIAERYFTALEVSRKSAGRYMQLKQNEEVDERYREMKKIIDNLQKYPKDRKSWQKEKQAREVQIAKAEKDKEARKEQFLAEIKRYDENKDKYYREIAPKIDAWEYKDGIRIGMDFNELQQTRKDWFKGHIKTTNGGSAINKPWKEPYSDRFEEIELSGERKVTYYKFRIVQRNDRLSYNNTKGVAQKAIENLRTYFGENLVFDELAFDDNYHSYVIKSPYSENKIILSVFKDTYVDILKVNNALPDGVKSININPANWAYDLNYLDRFVGTYKGADENGVMHTFLVSRVANLSLLEVKTTHEDNSYTKVYLAQKKLKNEFENYYIEEYDGKGGMKGNRFQDKDKYNVIFNIEQGDYTVQYKSGKEFKRIKQ